jgi:hypothetical protein
MRILIADDDAVSLLAIKAMSSKCVHAAGDANPIRLDWAHMTWYNGTLVRQQTA